MHGKYRNKVASSIAALVSVLTLASCATGNMTNAEASNAMATAAQELIDAPGFVVSYQNGDGSTFETTYQKPDRFKQIVKGKHETVTVIVNDVWTDAHGKGDFEEAATPVASELKDLIFGPINGLRNSDFKGRLGLNEFSFKVKPSTPDTSAVSGEASLKKDKLTRLKTVDVKGFESELKFSEIGKVSDIRPSINFRKVPVDRRCDASGQPVDASTLTCG